MRSNLPKNEPAFELQRSLLAHLETIWQKPDEGIWEVRGPRRHFTHSKVMAWVAFDRTIKSCQKLGLDIALEHWCEIRERIHEDVCQHGFDQELNSFVQSYGSKDLDASLLLLPLVGFLPSSDPRVAGTVGAIERDLMCGGFVQRYNSRTTDDGLQPQTHITTTSALQSWVDAFRSLSWIKGASGKDRTLCGGFFAGIPLTEAGIDDDDRVLLLRWGQADMGRFSVVYERSSPGAESSEFSPRY